MLTTAAGGLQLSQKLNKANNKGSTTAQSQLKLSCNSFQLLRLMYF